MNKVKECAGIFAIGAVGYSCIELAWRGFTHWSMAVAGGSCFLLIHTVNRKWPSKKLWVKSLMGAGIITGVEFVTGCVVNLLMHWDVWDYSHRAFHLLGQVCPLFSVLWFLLCIPVLLLSSLLGRKFQQHKEGR